MKIASIAILKKELKSLSPDELLNVCLRITKYKLENKELLNYLLFEVHDEDLFITNVKEVSVEALKKMNTSSYYFAKKTIRKVLRYLKKQIKYSGQKRTEVELLIFFCLQIKETKLSIRGNTALENLYKRQIQLIEKSLATLHEDLQFDYQDQIKFLKTL